MITEMVFIPTSQGADAIRKWLRLSQSLPAGNEPGQLRRTPTEESLDQLLMSSNPRVSDLTDPAQMKMK